MQISIQQFASPRGEIRLFSIENSSGARVVLSNLGAGVISVIVPDSKGEFDDVVAGYADPSDYICDGPCMGKTPGRYANRICRGRFSLDGKAYQLDCNCGIHALHGGPEGFMNKIWTARVDEELGEVEFSLVSPDGDEGYPGELTAIVKYRWTELNELHIEYRATTNAPTIVNFTNHAYFNLDGHHSGCALHHKLRVDASTWVETDGTLEPTGVLATVVGTPMDFRTSVEIDSLIHKDFDALRYGKGYDHCYVLDNPQMGHVQVELVAPKSGRRLEVETDQPGVQIYTANWLTGSSPTGKGGVNYCDYDSVAIECQGLPDAPNHERFPSQILRPGEEYLRHILYRFISAI